VADNNVPLTDVSVGVTGAHDPTGHVQTPYSSPTKVFSIDTLGAPPATANASATTSRTMVTDADVGTVFSVRIAYDETMDTRLNPDVHLTDDQGHPGPDVTLTNYRGFWGSDRIFFVQYDVVDHNQSFPHVNVVVAGAKDTIGHVQNAYTAVDLFNINTVTTPPSVVTATPNLAVVRDSNAGTNTFWVRIHYDHNPMSTNANAVVSFVTDTPAHAADVANTLTYHGSWWISNTDFYVQYNVLDVNVTVPWVGIKVKGAQDAGGSIQFRYEGSGFSIDTVTGPLAAPLADAVLSSGALNLSIGVLSAPTAQQSATDPIDQALALTGTWLDA
jgi:hypothetical protein